MLVCLLGVLWISGTPLSSLSIPKMQSILSDPPDKSISLSQIFPTDTHSGPNSGKNKAGHREVNITVCLYTSRWYVCGFRCMCPVLRKCMLLNTMERERRSSRKKCVWLHVQRILAAGSETFDSHRRHPGSQFVRHICMVYLHRKKVTPCRLIHRIDAGSPYSMHSWVKGDVTSRNLLIKVTLDSLLTWLQMLLMLRWIVAVNHRLADTGCSVIVKTSRGKRRWFI